jgi:hypothetical protein
MLPHTTYPATFQKNAEAVGNFGALASLAMPTGKRDAKLELPLWIESGWQLMVFVVVGSVAVLSVLGGARDFEIPAGPPALRL